MMWAVGLLIYIWENCTVIMNNADQPQCKRNIRNTGRLFDKTMEIVKKSDEMVVRFVRHDYVNGVMTT